MVAPAACSVKRFAGKRRTEVSRFLSPHPQGARKAKLAGMALFKAYDIRGVVPDELEALGLA